MLKELLTKYLADDAKVTEFLEEMKANKIFTAGEENLDKRYSKLKGEFDAKDAEYQQAQALIEELKQTNSNNEGLQSKITEYETTIATLKAENAKLEQENNLKVALLANKAKPEDIDYLMFKISTGDSEVKVDDKGEITNLKDLMDGLKKNYPSHFEVEAKKKIDVNKLPENKDEPDTITKEQFEKMGYAERNKLYHENKELYDKLYNEGKEE